MKKEKYYGVFYWRSTRPRNNSKLYHPVYTEGVVHGGLMGWMRSEVVRAESLSDALDMAEPLPGDNVMNSHSVINV